MHTLFAWQAKRCRNCVQERAIKVENAFRCILKLAGIKFRQMTLHTALREADVGDVAFVHHLSKHFAKHGHWRYDGYEREHGLICACIDKETFLIKHSNQGLPSTTCECGADLWIYEDSKGIPIGFSLMKHPETVVSGPNILQDMLQHYEAYRIAIHPDQQRKGHGRKMIALLLKKYNKDTITTRCRPESVSMQRLLIQFGFRVRELSSAIGATELWLER